MRYKNASSLVFLLASLGVYIVLQNIISLIFGDTTKSLYSSSIQRGIDILGARITSTQILVVLISIFISSSVLILIQKTKIGITIRALANDFELAKISGVNENRALFGIFFLGSALAGIAGVLYAIDIEMSPSMGLNALMMGIVVVIIGGIGSFSGVILGSLFLGMAQHFGVWKISSQWQNAIAFVILLIFLLIRPQGFLGKKLKKSYF